MGVGLAAAVLVTVIASAAYACTNFVGYLKVFGNGSGSATVTATGDQTYGDPNEGMTQTVSSTTAKVPRSGTGSITIETARSARRRASVRRPTMSTGRLSATPATGRG